SGPSGNPWGTIPSYLNQMAADLAKANPSTPTRGVPPSTTASNGNPKGINNAHQLNFECRANCALTLSSSFPHSQNLIAVGTTEYSGEISTTYVAVSPITKLVLSGTFLSARINKSNS